MTPREKIEQHFLAFEKIHEGCFEGREDWGALADFMTPDIDYTDPGWGRMHDRDTVTQFLRDSMKGLEDWDFPMRWYAIEGDHVIKKYSMTLKFNDTDYDISGVYMMHYAGDGKFDWIEDQLNMTHFMTVMRNSGWQPGPGFIAPRNLNWD